MGKHGLADPARVRAAKLCEEGCHRVGVGIIPLGGKAEGVVRCRCVATLASGLSKVSIKQCQGGLELASADKVQAVLGRLKGGLGLAAY